MGAIGARITFDDVEGVRFGRFDRGVTSSCIVYRVLGTVIDTGPPNQWRHVHRFLREREIDQVVITHHHEDHSGNGARLKTQLRAPVYMPENGVPLAEQGFPLQPYRRVVWGTPPRFSPEPLPNEVRPGKGILLRPIDTPGHSPDMTCFLEPNRGWLFTGDLFIATRPKYFRADESLDDQIQSLERVLELEFDTAFCAHRAVVTDARVAVRAKFDYLRSLRDHAKELSARGMELREITAELLGKETATSYLTLLHFSKRNLIRACLESTAQ